MGNSQALAPLVVGLVIVSYFGGRQTLDWILGIVATNPWLAGLILATIIVTAIGQR